MQKNRIFFIFITVIFIFDFAQAQKISKSNLDSFMYEYSAALNAITDINFPRSYREKKRKEFKDLFVKEAQIPNDLNYIIKGHKGSDRISPNNYSLELLKSKCCRSDFRFLRFSKINHDSIIADTVAVFRKIIIDLDASEDTLYYESIKMYLQREADTLIKVVGIIQIPDADFDGFNDNGEDDCLGTPGPNKGCPVVDTIPPSPPPSNDTSIVGTEGGGEENAPYVGPPDTLLNTNIAEQNFSDTLKYLFFDYADTEEKLIAISKSGELILFDIDSDGKLHFEARRNFEHLDSAFIHKSDIIHIRAKTKEKGAFKWVWKETTKKRRSFTKAEDLVPAKPKHYGASQNKSKYIFTHNPEEKDQVGLVITDTTTNYSQILLDDAPVDYNKVKVNQSENCLVALGQERIYIWKRNDASNVWQEVENHHNIDLKLASIVSKIEVNNAGKLVFFGTHFGQLLVYVIS